MKGRNIVNDRAVEASLYLIHSGPANANHPGAYENCRAAAEH